MPCREAWFKSRLHLGMAGVDARRATPPDRILPAFTEARRVRRPPPEQACTRPTFTGTERASGSRKKPVHEGPAQMTGLHRKPLRPFGYRLLKLRFCCFRATTPAVAEAGRGHKTIALKSLYKTHLTYTDQVYGRKCRRNRSSRSPRGVIPAEQAYPVLVPGGLRVAGILR